MVNPMTGAEQVDAADLRLRVVRARVATSKQLGDRARAR